MTRCAVRDLLRIFKSSYFEVLPDRLIRKYLKYDPKMENLSIVGDTFNLVCKNVYVVGAGKAVQYMAREMENLLGPKIKKGIVSIPSNSLEQYAGNTIIQYYEGAPNNLPDKNAKFTAILIKDLASQLTQDDVLVVLLSGGGSALLPLPIEPITLQEKTALIKKLANSGADIKELNTVRKRISKIKGGKLAIAASPAFIITLIISDIVGDPLGLIASGPTIKDDDNTEKALNILHKFNLYADLPDSIKEVLQNSTQGEAFPSGGTVSYVLGSNKNSILAAHNESKNLKYHPLILCKTVTGNVKDVAKIYVNLCIYFKEYISGVFNLAKLKQQVETLKIHLPGIETDFIDSLVRYPDAKEKGLCLILSGETTVKVTGNGLGGRNQQLALEFSKLIHKHRDEFNSCGVHFLSGGTDGIDGPTDAAGAIGYLDLVTDCEKMNIDINQYIENNDCYNFYKKFKNGDMHVITGHTHTNVMDIHLIVIQKLRSEING